MDISNLARSLARPNRLPPPDGFVWIESTEEIAGEFGDGFVCGLRVEDGHPDAYWIATHDGMVTAGPASDGPWPMPVVLALGPEATRLVLVAV